MANLRPIIRNKKSQTGFETWFLVIVVLLAFGLFFVVLNKAWTAVKPELQTGLDSSLVGHDTSNVNITQVLNQTTTTNRLYDKLIPFIIIGLFGFVMITAGAIIRHPIMIFVGIIILGVVITLAIVYSNIYNELSSSASFSDEKANLPITDKFMQYLPLIVFLMALGITIAIIWSRNSPGGGL